MTNETHDPGLRSWVESANVPGCDFPIQNLPYGIFRAGGGAPSVGIAIGDRILDVAACVQAGLLEGIAPAARVACLAPALNALMALPSADRSVLRERVSALLAYGAPDRERVARMLVYQHDVELRLPAAIGNYTDFYASIEHATNVGSMFRPDNPLLPNYKYVPIGYHGRASSVVPSGTVVRRPNGQTKGADAAEPTFGPCRMLDYEAEIGFYVARGNLLGEPVPLHAAEEHLFGIGLLNDWSARDVQAWEYQPLGPFLAKSFASTVSPWVVTWEALAPFRVPAAARPVGDPAPLSYLYDERNERGGGIALAIDVFLSSERMRRDEVAPHRVSRSELAGLYWTPAQLLAHHTSNGCNLQPGDLLGSGTISGKEPESRGCLLERTWRGRDPICLPTGEERTFLQDGDEVLMRGSCHAEGYVSIGLGECRGTILPAS